MRTGTSDILSQGYSGRLRLTGRLRRARKSQNYRMDLEGLESRTLLATIPAATPTPGGPTNISSLMGNVGGVNASESSSIVAVDPLDPSKLVAVWIDNDPTMFADTNGTYESVLKAAYSTDAGVQWNVLLGEPISGLPNAPIIYNPATNNPIVPYVNVSSPSLGFDDSGNFYILSEYTGGSSRALVLQRYKFTGSTPTTVSFTTNANPTSYAPSSAKVVYQWVSSGTDDQAYDPTMTVDDNLSTIPSGVASPADPYSGDVYISWASIDINTAIPIAPFNPNRITVEVSSDGGNNFGPATIAGAGNVTGEHDATPASRSARAACRLKAAYQVIPGSQPARSRSHLTILAPISSRSWPTRSPLAPIIRSAVRPAASISVPLHRSRTRSMSATPARWTVSMSRSISSIPMMHTWASYWSHPAAPHTRWF